MAAGFGSTQTRWRMVVVTHFSKNLPPPEHVLLKVCSARSHMLNRIVSLAQFSVSVYKWTRLGIHHLT